MDQRSIVYMYVQLQWQMPIAKSSLVPYFPNCHIIYGSPPSLSMDTYIITCDKLRTHTGLELV